jgi:uncharacterized protein YaiI (UPF0178 family)
MCLTQVVLKSDSRIYSTRMIERAYALRDARENERRKIVKEKTQQQWRNACDDVRILDSKALTQYMVSHVLELSF